MFWKDLGGVLLNFLLENEAKEKTPEFHKGDCGGNLYWKITTYNILRGGLYCPTLVLDIYKEISTYHECQIFEGRRKLLPLPLKPISIEAPFQRWGLAFIGEINPAYSGQHKWILTTTDYFTKWIEVVPTRQATNTMIIEFLLNNIIFRFGFLRKLIIDNAHTFKSNKMVKFCNNYNTILAHSTTYYP